MRVTPRALGPTTISDHHHWRSSPGESTLAKPRDPESVEPRPVVGAHAVTVTDRGAFQRAPIAPDRVRCIDSSFAFIPHRFLRAGFFTSLSADERSLYLFLVLAGDRAGVSFYSYDRICSSLEIDPDRFLEARNGLLAKDLIAFDGTCFQVLSLPPSPRWNAAPHAGEDAEERDTATIRHLIARSFGACGK